MTMNSLATRFGRPMPEKPDEITADYLYECSAGSSIADSGGPSSDWSSSAGSNSFARRRRRFSRLSGSLGWTSATESEYSWGDDEFDRQASATVKRMFDEIYSALYEGETQGISYQTPTGSECSVWRANFPHFRLVGVQLVDTYEGDGDDFLPFMSHYPPPFPLRLLGAEGNVLEDVSVDETGSLTSPSMADVSSLVIQGKKIKLKKLPNSRKDYDIGNGSLQEEVLAEDGVFEEYIAFDSSEIDLCGIRPKKEFHRRQRHQRRLGLPPVTPNACVKDSAVSEIFDRIWSDLLVQLRPLLDIFKEKISDEGTGTPTPTTVLDDVLTDTLQAGPAESTLSRSFAPQSGSGSQVRLRTFYGASMPLTGSTAVSSISDLQKVMTVRSLTLRQRQSGVLHQIPGGSDSRPGSREGTPLIAIRPDSNIRSGRFGGIFISRASDHQLANAKPITPKHMYRRLGPSLKPLERTRTPVMDDMEILRGHKLYTGNERISTPSTSSWGSRNGTLPPIDHLLNNRVEAEYSSPPQRRLISSPKVKVHFGNLLQTTEVNDTAMLLNARGIGPEARPSTMHAARAETPVKGILRRSSTPLSGGLHHTRLKHGGSSMGNVGLTRLTSYRRDGGHLISGAGSWGTGGAILSEEEDEPDDSVSTWNAHIPQSNSLSRRPKGTLR